MVPVAEEEEAVDDLIRVPKWQQPRWRLAMIITGWSDSRKHGSAALRIVDSPSCASHHCRLHAHRLTLVALVAAVQMKGYWLWIAGNLSPVGSGHMSGRAKESAEAAHINRATWEESALDAGRTRPPPSSPPWLAPHRQGTTGRGDFSQRRHPSRG